MANQPQGTFLGHPKGLYILFFTEMWERFSYYGMRALLILYMTNFHKWNQADASSIYKWYTSLVYLTPLLGGYLADRYLGNKRAIIIGASLMAVGHFCMAFEQIEIFYVALGFLIIGNGFFKPNMSVQVGRLYPTNDPRRDSAYTIFYMGINLGAFAAPLVCGWLQESPNWGFHWGFGAAGVGMVLGLIVYLVGQSWVQEIPESIVYEGNDESKKEGDTADSHYMTEEEASTAPSVFPRIAAAAPTALLVLAIVMPIVALVLYFTDVTKLDNAFALGVGGGFACGMGAWITKQLGMAVRDRVLAIFVMAVFVVFFWSAFEQAGNSMTIFADKTTDRYITQDAPLPSIYPEVVDAPAAASPASMWQGWVKLWNPVSTAWFQSINALAIFLLAPLFAWMWVALPRRGIKLSIPAKIAIGVFGQSAAFLLMWWAITYENQPSSAPLASLPAGTVVDEEGRVAFRAEPELGKDDALEKFSTQSMEDAKMHIVAGGRILFDDSAATLNMTGVLSDNDRDELLRATVSQSYLTAIWNFALQTAEAKKNNPDGFTVEMDLTDPPEGFDLRFAGFKPEDVRYEDGKLIATIELADKDYKALLVAGADSAFRGALNQLYVASAAFKVSAWWLFWFYILCTLGELCLSPVGLSMVSKLAPAKFATMLMGMWLLTSFFGNFLAGFAGESYGKVHPAEYFIIVAVGVGVAAFVCVLVVKKTKAMMHGVD